MQQEQADRKYVSSSVIETAEIQHKELLIPPNLPVLKRSLSDVSVVGALLYHNQPFSIRQICLKA